LMHPITYPTWTIIIVNPGRGTFSIAYPTWIALLMNPSVRVEKPAINCLGYGMRILTSDGQPVTVFV
jgi:hypothetical protein